MKSAVTITNAGLAFALEMAMLAVLVYWGIHTGGNGLAKAALAVGAPAAAIAIWATFLAAGGHPVNLPTVPEAALKLAVFLVAALALAGTGHRTMAIAFAALAVLSVLIEYTVGT
ncbi:YrdB family protein [Catenulispora pinisilvae]|uniref:YrdB family protein n=1 Tax=Catenulispora pinisilvae TaxID=2705253 RepID=UPI001891517D|nr:YrdB family protein [Catenulispora pinisilvae]